MTEQQVSAVRRFNRAYTQRIGALEESFLGLDLPLPAARVLFESRAGASTLDLRAQLTLDSGYLSRLLRRLEDDGLVSVSADPTDRRRRLVVPTAQGERLLERLEQASDDQAHRLLDPLSPGQRERLRAALETAELLVRAATLDLAERPGDDPAVVAAVGRYFAELDARFPQGFDPGPPEQAIDPAGRYLLAVDDGRAVAVGGLRTLAPGTAEIKRMWVDPRWRGAGLGSRLLRSLEGWAVESGHARVVLDTHRTLTDALALYARAGYVEIERYNDNPYAEAFFAKDLTPPA